MSYALKLLDGVRRAAAPRDESLAEARTRRDAVLAVAAGFPGARETFVSGSTAHGTANEVKDADCGVVVDRAHYPALGPDGDDVGPVEIAEGFRIHLRESQLRLQWPEISFFVDNRAITVSFHRPLADGCDPTVDLIVGLERKAAPGLWIPKGMRTSSPDWDASHPQEHVRLFLPSDRQLRRTRVWVTRLAKLANSRYTNWAFSSFNLASLAFWGLAQSSSLDQALFDFYDFAVKDLTQHLTHDPADVSGPIKLPKNTNLSHAVDRMEKHRALVEQALDAQTEDEAREALHKLFPGWLEAPPTNAAATIARALREGSLVSAGTTGLSVGSAGGRDIKPTRSYGHV